MHHLIVHELSIFVVFWWSYYQVQPHLVCGMRLSPRFPHRVCGLNGILFLFFLATKLLMDLWRLPWYHLAFSISLARLLRVLMVFSISSGRASESFKMASMSSRLSVLSSRTNEAIGVIWQTPIKAQKRSKTANRLFPIIVNLVWSIFKKR